MLPRFLTMFCLALLAMGTLSGCGTTTNPGVGTPIGAAGAGIADYRNGELVASHRVTLDVSAAATEVALLELKLQTISAQKNTEGMSYLCRDIGDQSIKIYLRAASPEITEIRIRCGDFGNEPKSTLIYNTIVKQLPTAEH